METIFIATLKYVSILVYDPLGVLNRPQEVSCFFQVNFCLFSQELLGVT